MPAADRNGQPLAEGDLVTVLARVSAIYPQSDGQSPQRVLVRIFTDPGDTGYGGMHETLRGGELERVTSSPTTQLLRDVQASLLTYRAKLAQYGCESWIDLDNLLPRIEKALPAEPAQTPA